MPCENIHDELPTYQTSALGRFLTDRLMARARSRVSERQASREQETPVEGNGDHHIASEFNGRHDNTISGRQPRREATSDRPQALPAEPTVPDGLGALYRPEERERVRRQHGRDGR